MTLNCLGAHNTGHQRRSRRWNALESPELRRRAGLLFKFSISNWTSERNWVWQGAQCSVHFLFLLAIWTLLMPGSGCLYTHIYFAVWQYEDNCTIVLNPILCEWKQLSKGSYFVQEEPIPPSHAPEPAAINGNYISSFDSAELNIGFYFYYSTLEWQASK